MACRVSLLGEIGSDSGGVAASQAGVCDLRARPDHLRTRLNPCLVELDEAVLSLLGCEQFGRPQVAVERKGERRGLRSDRSACQLSGGLLVKGLMRLT